MHHKSCDGEDDDARGDERDDTFGIPHFLHHDTDVLVLPEKQVTMERPLFGHFQCLHQIIVQLSNCQESSVRRNMLRWGSISFEFQNALVSLTLFIQKKKKK